jgi:DNA-binding response OmpR family regulator
LHQARTRLGQVVIVGETLCVNEWLSTMLEEHSFAVARYPHARHVAPREVSDDAAILLDASPPSRQACLDLLPRLPPRQRQRTLVVGWSLDARVTRLFIDAGVADFLDMPASTGELLLRLELRLRDAAAPDDEPQSENAEVPRADPLTGTIGSPVQGVRLSERELLLYNLLVEQIGGVVSREEILRRIWGRDGRDIPTSNIVDVYIRYLRVKLARAAPTLRIVSLRHVGYSLRVAEPEEPNG